MSLQVTDVAMRQAERRLYDWQMGTGGGFFKHLYDALAHADGENFAKLTIAFPHDAYVVNAYKMVSGYWEDLRAEVESSGSGESKPVEEEAADLTDTGEDNI